MNSESCGATRVTVLFVCMGNICRSPTAEAVFRVQAEAVGLTVSVASAGTHAYHTGRPPDVRAQAAARARGLEMSGQRAQVVSAELLRADYVLVMDEENLRDLQASFPGVSAQKFMTFASLEVRARYGDDVPDPYYGAEDGFLQVLEMLSAASAGLVQAVQNR